MAFKSTFKTKLVYVYAIPDEAHEGCLKVGETTIDYANIGDLKPNCHELNVAAKARINHQTQTAGVYYQLLYTEILTYVKDGKTKTANDGAVHDVLERSGIKKKIFNTEAKANEWFITDLETIKKAIVAAKEERKSLTPIEITKDRTPVVFRPEQKDAITKTIKRFKGGGDRMLWYAKMRFGKTLSALQVVKEMQFKRTIIITHRPVVDEGWFNDFDKIFYDSPDYAYSSRNKGDSYDNLERKANKGEQKYIYFASIQDLRGSEEVGGKFLKNADVFATSWDLLIIDEAHEGTLTELGLNVKDALVKPQTKVIHLSGTPFNLLDDFNDAETYTWDYVMEQRAKSNWDLIHCGDTNPYSCLPKMNIYTYDLGKLFEEFKDDGGAFNFREFFKVLEDGTFKHKDDVFSFLNLLTKEETDSEYPYSKQEYRDNFRHSLWMVPGVREAKALSEMLHNHPVFSLFRIVNVAGDGDEEKDYSNALMEVQSAVKNHQYTITLSCGRLTTGVSVPEWTTVLMLAGSYSTAASSYMQTIFRVQTPATIDGKIKEECFVFDFAPDRTLKVVAETAKFSVKGGKGNRDSDRKKIEDFLNFCPIISIEGSTMKEYQVPNMLEQLKRVYIERVVSRGFEDIYLYDNDALMQLDSLALEEFDKLKGKIGETRANHNTGEIDLNNQGFTNEERERLEQAEEKKRKKQPLSDEELQLLEEKKNKDKNRLTAISILRGISIRMPLLIYGSEISNEDDINLDNFTTLVDDLSWNEFMPYGVSKEDFNTFKKYYDKEVFSASGRRIREMAKAADGKPVEERIERIASIFGSFRNPDKETVLTPWRVVNMHLSDCLGGWNFYDEQHINHSSSPRWVYKGKVTDDVFNPQSKILEINSKSGLYPLYMAYGIYKSKLQQMAREGRILSDEEQLDVWDETVRDNIFVICKTPMAKSITNRTLMGFRNKKANTRYFEDLINQIKNKQENFIETVSNTKNYGSNNKKSNIEMKFDAIVGNPPYQIMDGGNNSSATPVYNRFVDIARRIKPSYISMIMPSRWYAGGKGLDEFRTSMLNDNHIARLIDYTDSKDCFPTVDIAGGICYFRWDISHNGDCEYSNTLKGKTETIIKPMNEYEVFIRYPKADSILSKVLTTSDRMSTMVSARKPFGLSTEVKSLESGDIFLRNTTGIGRYKSSLVQNGQNLIDKWKVMISYLTSEHAGQPDKNGQFRVLSTMEILPPKHVCTETYLIAGSFDTEEEAKNLMSYLKTKLVRLLIGQIAIGQHITRSCFNFVPVQDFTKPWTDADLYKKYGLSDDEIGFVESMIKPL